MTRKTISAEQYREVLDGLNRIPPRHLLVNGVQPHSVDELNRLAVRWGYIPPTAQVAEIAEPVAVPPDQSSVGETSGPPTPPASPSTPSTPSAPQKPGPKKTAPKPKGAGSADDGRTSTPPAKPEGGQGAQKPEIPENLGTLTYNQLRALAKTLGISPVPGPQAELMAAIDAVRGE